MSKHILKQPIIPSHLPSEPYKVPDDGLLNTKLIENCSISGEQTNRLIIEQVIFKNVVFEQVSFSHIELTDVRFINYDLSNADFTEAIIHRVTFEGCKMLGIILADTTLGNVLFQACQGHLSSFGFANMTHVYFDACFLEQSDFYECTFKQVQFEQCRLNDTNFAGTSLKGIDLSTSVFEHLQITLNELAGCTVTPDQALGFAKALGIVIKE